MSIKRDYGRIVRDMAQTDTHARWVNVELDGGVQVEIEITVLRVKDTKAGVCTEYFKPQGAYIPEGETIH